jgi:hypothetical protein
MPHTDATPTLLPNPPRAAGGRGSKKNAALHARSKKEFLFVAYATACVWPASWYPQQPHQRSSGVHMRAQYPPPSCEDPARIQLTNAAQLRVSLSATLEGARLPRARILTPIGSRFYRVHLKACNLAVRARRIYQAENYAFVTLQRSSNHMPRSPACLCTTHCAAIVARLTFGTSILNPSPGHDASRFHTTTSCGVSYHAEDGDSHVSAFQLYVPGSRTI